MYSILRTRLRARLRVHAFAHAYAHFSHEELSNATNQGFLALFVKKLLFYN